jgi:peptidoglycan pentaglycine glycine transferase (the first glycine)
MLNHTPLRQSIAWADFLKSQGWNTKREIWGGHEIHIFIKDLPFFGSVIKSQRQKNPLRIEAIENIAKTSNAIQITIEPYINFNQENAFRSRGYKLSSEALVPPKTLLIDLEQSEDEILSQMHYSGRRGIHNAKKKGTQVRKVQTTNHNLQLLAQALGQVAKRQDFKAPGFQTLKNKTSAFGQDANLFFAYKNSRFIGAVLTLSANNTLHYHHSASSNLGRENYAAYLLVWEAILWGKRQNHTTFDFGGIADPRFPRTSSWEGFTEFKKKFGGRTIEWPRPLTKWRLPF